MARPRRRLIHLAVLCWAVAASVRLYADGARFDLTGPKIEVRVTRNGRMLPIASVPNLQPGDRLWLHPDLPADQSAHYLLIAAFLRGTTNPPPENWFTRIPAWDKKVRSEGVYVTVPQEAEQALLFLAPETGGDFGTLKSAVMGRPGVFVRASQDLAEAGFEQGRIERYLAAMKQVPPNDPKAIAEHSGSLARTLNLKPNPDCFKQPVDLQYTCLTQTGNQSLLDDGHGQTLASALSNGPGSDLINQASYTQMAGGGIYSAYVGAIVDLVRLTSGLRTAQFQYIPAVAFPEEDDLNLKLNTAPSFHNPKSVIVIGLPAVQNSVPPPLRAVDPNIVTCLLKPNVALPVEGAPLVFATGFAHDLVLHIQGTDAKDDISLTPNAYEGGLLLSATPSRHVLPADPSAPRQSAEPAEPKPAKSAAAGPPPPPLPVIPPGSNEILGTITGFWGFDPYTGPTLRLQNQPGTGWRIATADNLIVGRENHFNLASTGTACIEAITLDGASGKEARAAFKPTDRPNHLDVTLTLKSVGPGDLHLSIKQFGDTQLAAVTATSFSEPARLTGLQYHAGDTFATLTGVSLNQVKQLTFRDLTFLPADVADPTADSLRFELPSGATAPELATGSPIAASVLLKDGRTLSFPGTVTPARPSITLLNKNIGSPEKAPIQLVNQDDLPVDQQITFSLKSAQNFPRNAQIEIANADESLKTSLTVAAQTLILQDPHTLLATLDPLKTFGISAFGPLRLRAISPDGVASDWQPLATLIRVPTLQELHCVADTTKSCTLSGTGLYLVSAISTNPDFTEPTAVPEGFVGSSIGMPHPSGSVFYIRLRDDPAAANPVTLPVIVDRPQRASRSSAPLHPSAPPPQTETPAAPPADPPPPTTVPTPASSEPQTAPVPPADSTQPPQAASTTP
ncbi:MAG TPA: hypothetical protein VGC07_11055 [Granulicella sp.]